MNRSKSAASSNHAISGLGDAVADIRERLVEEAWSGRTTNGRKPEFKELVASFYGPGKKLDPNALERDLSAEIDR